MRCPRRTRVRRRTRSRSRIWPIPARNPYAHLAFGCALFMVLGAIPFVGDFVIAAALLIGIGSVVATRAAGLMPQKNGLVGTPYRDAPIF